MVISEKQSSPERPQITPEEFDKCFERFIHEKEPDFSERFQNDIREHDKLSTDKIGLEAELAKKETEHEGLSEDPQNHIAFMRLERDLRGKIKELKKSLVENKKQGIELEQKISQDILLLITQADHNHAKIAHIFEYAKNNVKDEALREKLLALETASISKPGLDADQAQKLADETGNQEVINRLIKHKEGQSTREGNIVMDPKQPSTLGEESRGEQVEPVVSTAQSGATVESSTIDPEITIDKPASDGGSAVLADGNKTVAERSGTNPLDDITKQESPIATSPTEAPETPAEPLEVSVVDKTLETEIQEPVVAEVPEVAAPAPEVESAPIGEGPFLSIEFVKGQPSNPVKGEVSTELVGSGAIETNKVEDVKKRIFGEAPSNPAIDTFLGVGKAKPGSESADNTNTISGGEVAAEYTGPFEKDIEEVTAQANGPVVEGVVSQEPAIAEPVLEQQVTEPVLEQEPVKIEQQPTPVKVEQSQPVVEAPNAYDNGLAAKREQQPELTISSNYQPVQTKRRWFNFGRRGDVTAAEAAKLSRNEINSSDKAA